MTMPGTQTADPEPGDRPTMRAVVYHGPGSVRVDEVDLPRIQHPRDVIVRVTRSAVCGTDLHPYRGELPGFAPGTVLGHEFAGTVHAAGPEVQFAIGTRVFASDVVACGRCETCALGRHYQCPVATLFGSDDLVGAPLPGGQAEFVRVPFADVVLAATPDDVTDEQALFVGDVLTTGLAAVHGAEVTPGDLVAVVGGGPLGLLAGLCAVTAGAGRVVVADPTPARRGRAVDLGFIAVTPDQLDEAVREGGARGADAVIEAVGSDAALACAVRAAAPHATVCAVGVHHSTAMPFPAGLAFARELTVRFAVGNPIRMREPVLALIRTGRLDPSRIVTHRLPLAAAASAYQLFDRQEAIKVVLHADDPILAT